MCEGGGSGPHCSSVLLPTHPTTTPPSEWDRPRRLVPICWVLQAGHRSIVAAQISQDADTLRFSIFNRDSLQHTRTHTCVHTGPAHTIKHPSDEHKLTVIAGDLFRCSPCDSSSVKNKPVAQSTAAFQLLLYSAADAAPNCDSRQQDAQGPESAESLR